MRVDISRIQVGFQIGARVELLVLVKKNHENYLSSDFALEKNRILLILALLSTAE
jgi:hypothetical protein